MGQQKMRGAPIHPKQIQIIKLAQKELGIGDDAYRDLLEEMFGVRSCTALNLDQANELIDELQRKGWRLIGKKGGRQVHGPRRQPAEKPARSTRESGNLVHLASADELAKISAVAALVKWELADGFSRWLRARFGLERVRTAGEAYKVIEGLKKLFEGQMKRAHDPDWWTIRFDDPAIEEYISRHAPATFRNSQGRVYKRGGC